MTVDSFGKESLLYVQECRHGYGSTRQNMDDIIVLVTWLLSAIVLGETVYQAEDGPVLAPLFTVVDAFRSYVTSNESDCSIKDPSNRNEGGLVTVTIAPSGYDGPCHLEALVRCPDSLSDSFWVSVDGDAFEPWYVGETPEWSWRPISPETVDWQSPGSAGTERHCFRARSGEAMSVRLKLREPGASLDAVRLMSIGSPSLTVVTSCGERGCDPLGGEELLVASEMLCGPAEVSDVVVTVDDVPCSNATWSRDMNAVRCVMPPAAQTATDADVSVSLWGMSSEIKGAIVYGPTCPPDCSVHGICVSDGNCHCLPGWSGNDCSTQTHRMLAPAMWSAIAIVLATVALAVLAFFLRKLRPFMRAPRSEFIAVAFSEVDLRTAVRTHVGMGTLLRAVGVHNETMIQRARELGGYSNIRPHDGRLVAVFDSVHKAVQWCLLAHADLMENDDWPGPTRGWVKSYTGTAAELTVRRGVHFTKDFVRKFDLARISWEYSGEGCEIARRVMQRADPGQNLITMQAYEGIGKAYKGSWGIKNGEFDNPGPVAFRNLGESGPRVTDSVRLHTLEFFSAGQMDCRRSDDDTTRSDLSGLDALWPVLGRLMKDKNCKKKAFNKILVDLLEVLPPMVPKCRFCGCRNEFIDMLRMYGERYKNVESIMGIGQGTDEKT